MASVFAIRKRSERLANKRSAFVGLAAPGQQMGQFGGHFHLAEAGALLEGDLVRMAQFGDGGLFLAEGGQAA